MTAGLAVALRIYGNNMKGKFNFRIDDLLIAIGYIFWLTEEVLQLYGNSHPQRSYQIHLLKLV